MTQQIISSITNIIKNSKNILLLTHQNMDGDGLSSMAALYIAFEKLGKKVNAYSMDSVPDELKFLPNVNTYIKNDINTSNDFIISLNCNDTKVERIKYNVDGDKVNIIITPKNGLFDENDISSKQGNSTFDTVIVLDVADIAQLGKIYKENTRLFTGSAVINIDHHLTNTHFGTANLVDPKATSTCEIILDVVEQMEKTFNTSLINKTIATYLLTGITVDTNSFQNSNTTAKAFSIASKLLALGADQQTIIKNLYKTHSLSTLKLWGKALSNIKTDKKTGLVWSIITKQDFESANANEQNIQDLLDKFIASTPGASIVFLIKELPENQVHCSIRTLDDTDASKLAMLFKGGGHKNAAGFRIKGDSLVKIENFIVKKFRDYKLNKIQLPKQITKENITKKSNVTNNTETEKFIKNAKEAIKAESPKP